MKAKIDAWKAMSQAISRKYKPHQIFEHAPPGAVMKTVEKANDKLPAQMNVDNETLIKWSWYAQKDYDLISKMFG